MDNKNNKVLVVGVRFVSGVKVYYFSANGVEYHKGEYVVVESQNGHELAKVVYEKKEINKKDLGDELLLNIVRVATGEDKKSVLDFHEIRKDYIKEAGKLANELKLQVKFLDVTRSLDETSRLLFLFAADGRVDFRELILKMSKQFQCPIRLYQVGPRDAARIVGGIGICGQKICCSRFLNKFESITMEIARDQDLVNMGSGKISGVCGKLLCCLDYEVDVYRELKKTMPELRTDVIVEKKKGIVIERNVLTQTVLVELEENRMKKSYPVSEVTIDKSNQDNKK
jgi:cell fate regulator YaaT (PSP1 superfamily)